MRLRLAAVATAILVGLLTIPLAFQQEVPTCKEWRRYRNRLNTVRRVTWYVLHPNGYDLPNAVTGFTIGNCAGGTCTMRHASCRGKIEYEFDNSAAAGGLRVKQFTGAPYFRAAWEAAAAADVNLDFSPGLPGLRAACRARATNPQCRTIIRSINDCYDINAEPGFTCRNGAKYGPGLGGVDDAGVLVTCTPVNQDVPTPCKE